MRWDLIGHEWAVELLEKRIQRGQVGHAFLISGPPGVGRRTLALRLAQALNCTQPEESGAPCRTCRICRQIENQQHADLFVVQAEREGGTLKVEQIRELQHSLSLHPYEARYRVALLLRFEEAHPSAMNALLKTLEEPSPQVILLLTADSPENLLPTVVSRCEAIRLRPIPYGQIETALQQRFRLTQEQACLAAHVSGGKPGLAVRLSNTPVLMEERTDGLNELAELLKASYRERFKRAEALSKDKIKLRVRLLTWLSFWRDVFLRSSGAAAPIANIDWIETIEGFASGLQVQEASRLVGTVERSVALLDQNVNPRLILEALMLELPKGSRLLQSG